MPESSRSSRAFARIRILDQDGVLSDFVGPNQIQEITYDERKNKVDSATIKLVSLSRAQADSEVLQEERPLQISYGVQGDWQIDRTVIIKELDFDYGSSISVSVMCRDLKQKYLDRKAGRIWTKKTASDIVIEIANLLDLTAVVVPTKGRVRVVQANRSYAKVLSDLAWMESYYWKVTDTSLIFEPAYDFERVEDQFTYYVGNTPDIFGFKIKETARRIAPAGSGTTAAGSDPEAGAQNTETNDPSTEATPDDKGKFVLSVTYNEDGTFQSREEKLKDKVTGEVDAHPGNEEPETAKKRARAKTLDAVWKGTTATFTTFNRRIETSQIVNVVGVATRHSGRYQVTAAKSVYKGGRIDTSVNISRNIKKPTDKKKGDDPKGDVNPSTENAPQEVEKKRSFSFNDDGSFDET